MYSHWAWTPTYAQKETFSASTGYFSFGLFQGNFNHFVSFEENSLSSPLCFFNHFSTKERNQRRNFSKKEEEPIDAWDTCEYVYIRDVESIQPEHLCS